MTRRRVLERDQKGREVYRGRSKGSSRTTRRGMEMREEGNILERKSLCSRLSHTSRRNHHETL